MPWSVESLIQVRFSRFFFTFRPATVAVKTFANMLRTCNGDSSRTKEWKLKHNMYIEGMHAPQVTVKET